ncbi:hypothetical protein BDV25DRAFT_166487 [Aspergillus avenaceus]|uniref:P-loop containing nucleoside triphosphate hydrolase protein n=1 Tax=Aspergillus avenaceus TaxID=36643 RepID=A0A5N6TDZ9_ASPAV|nr:hypothetical protein BDV25DRAFT_166487 [Aspergillus avenaceus]
MDVSRAVERVPMSMPLCGFYEGYSWTYSECLYRQEGVLYPKTMYPTPVSSIPLKRSPLIFIIGKPYTLPDAMPRPLTAPGGPGSGKSTVAANLAADLGLVHIEPDVIVGRLSLTGPPQAWDAVKNTMNEHGQVPEWMLNVLVKMEILKHQESSSCIFLMDNFPKTAAQFRVFSDVRILPFPPLYSTW